MPDVNDLRIQYDALPEEHIAKADWDLLLQYDLSLPTGREHGKTWKQNLYGLGLWLLCRYEQDAQGWTIIRHRPIIDYPPIEDDSDEPMAFCDCTECPCNVPLEDSLWDVCRDCAEGRHMDEKGERKD